MRIVVAEDEPPMQQRLLAQLAKVSPDSQVVAVANNGADAWQAILEHRPDVAFLDIRLPTMSGIEVATRIVSLPAESRCQVVFVTAYDQYAIEAFEAGAIDYILKPIETERLMRTLERIDRPTPSEAPLAALLSKLRQTEVPVERLQWLKVSLGQRVKLVNVDDVLFFQSDTKYTRVVTANFEALVRTPLKDLLACLDPSSFWQIHRSSVVNIRAIDSVERVNAERLKVTLKNGAGELAVSRAFAYQFKE